MSPGDRVLMYETGHFATLWKNMALKLGITPEFIESDWRGGVDANKIEERLRADKGREIKAVCVVHNETSTGATSDIAAVRKAIDAAGPSGAAAGGHHLIARRPSIIATTIGAWTVTVAGSQKG
jgi:alanine-glyoxylate transaminase/serine-glyoxylate transaminase/serine-pyruvate transaminase